MRDLGVATNTNLALGSHCKGLINTCDRTMGMIKRTVGLMLLLMLRPLCNVNRYGVTQNIVLECGLPVQFQIQKLLSQYRQLLLAIFFIVRKLNTSIYAPCFISIHNLTDEKLQICFMFSKVLKVTMTYPGIII